MAERPLIQEVQIINRRGLHARASAKFVRLQEGSSTIVEVCKDAMCVSGTSIMGLMMLAAAKGDIIRIEVSGEGRDLMLAELVALVESKFGEVE